MHVVWFKRDLRLADHAPLTQAIAAAGKQGLVCLYVYEPDVLQSPEWDHSHSVFIDQCLQELDAALRGRGGRLCYRYGAVPAVLSQLHKQQAITHLYSHEETGNGLTYSRDQAVAAWCRQQRVQWAELPQTGVIRRLRDRDGWSRLWSQRMKQEPIPEPQALTAVPGIEAGDRLPPGDLVKRPSTVSSCLQGGRGPGRRLLDDFLSQRGFRYQTEMSSPVTAMESCSRLSPYLAYGALSMREVHHAVEAAKLKIKGQRGEEAKTWRASYNSFAKRLRWHCHFMQKLEDEPRLEFENMHPGFDGLREPYFDTTRFAAWKKGETGYPLVDACMRCVAQTGWLNFRMRAMVVSFASYHLWLHWRETATWLARHFIDFEPGIHYSQVQMQSGVTGINTLRIYSPIKQVLDQDPQGIFIRKWVPELADLPDEYLSQPESLPPLLQQSYGVQPGSSYPLPIVDHPTAVSKARSAIAKRRAQPEVRAMSEAVYQKHGSRRRPQKRRKSVKQ